MCGRVVGWRGRVQFISEMSYCGRDLRRCGASVSRQLVARCNGRAHTVTCSLSYAHARAWWSIGGYSLRAPKRSHTEHRLTNE
jgi:hypothetical protein